MKIAVQPGKYVVAVSGGVDSMVLLDVLSTQPGLELVVAHFEHGIRPDSDADRQLVERAAEGYKLPFIYERGQLGTHASEARARTARYAFLHRVRQTEKARAIMTAHHQDDLLETAVINMLRGTGRKGLHSLASTGNIIRPFLHITKAVLYEYARAHQAMTWHEDSTNSQDNYLRNYIRHHVTNALSTPQTAELLAYITHAGQTNPVIDALLQRNLAAHTGADGLDRAWFIMLPHDVACEVMAAWLRQTSIRDFDRHTIENLVIFGKVAQPGKVRDVIAGYWLQADKTKLRLTRVRPS